MAKLYAIAADMPQARRLLHAQVPYLQLRFKKRAGGPSPFTGLLHTLRDWHEQYPHTRLIINDDVDVALSVKAWGVHLGWEDLASYQPADLAGLPLALGLSTHDEAEVQRAQNDWGPSYIGFGPLFSTRSKSVAFSPRGTAHLRKILACSACPVVAIGGIGRPHLGAVKATGVPLVAMLSALAACADSAAVQDLMYALA